MIELKNVSREYQQGGETVRALHALSFHLRDRELAVVQGESGSGKSTLLRLLAGMENCSQGEILYAGRSTKSFKAADWAGWRSAAVGLMMGKDDLLGSETAAQNVELPMSLAGMSRGVRHKRTVQLLRRVGLGDQMNALPAALTEYGRRRLSVARALANDPDAILAEEPFRGLSAENASELMSLFEAIAKDRLVVLCCTNDIPAHSEGVRTLHLLNGRLLSDSDPWRSGESEVEPRKWHRSILPGRDSLRLALHAARGRRGALACGVLAASLALSCLGLRLGLEASLQRAQEQEQREALTLAPLVVEREALSEELLLEVLDDTASPGEHPNDGIYSANRRATLLSAQPALGQSNSLTALKQELEQQSGLCALVQTVDHTELHIYASDTSLGLREMQNENGLWQELPGDGSILKNQYEVVAGRWCSSWDELVLFVDESYELTDVEMAALGLSGGESGKRNFEELCSVTYRLLLPTDYYQKNPNGSWAKLQDESLLRTAVNEGSVLRVVGIVRPKESSAVHAFGGTMGYPSALREHMAEAVENAEAVRQQKENPGLDVFTGLPFMSSEERSYTNAQKAAALRGMVAQELDIPTQMAMYCRITGCSEADAAYKVSNNVLSAELSEKLNALPEGDCAGLYNSFILPGLAQSSYEANLTALGADGGEAERLLIYTESLAQRSALLSYLRSRNARAVSEGRWTELVRPRDEAVALAAASGTQNGLLLSLLTAFSVVALLSAFGLLCALLNAAAERQRGTLRSLTLLGISPSDRAGLLRTEGLLLGLACSILGFGLSLGLSALLPRLGEALWGLQLRPGISWLAAAIALPGGILMGLFASLPACKRASRFH